jgi:hypothetical protein
MIVQNLFQPKDTYGEPIVTLSALPISIFIFNNPIRITVLKKNPGGGQDFERMPEQVISPGSCQITGSVGFIVKNANAGFQSIISYAIPEFQKDSPDPSIVGFTPNTLSVTAAGVVTASPINVYAKNNSLIDITTPSGNVETDILNVPIKAADLTINSIFKFYLECDYLDNVADANLTFRGYIGATKLLDSGAQVAGQGAAVGANRLPMLIEGAIVLRGALNNQWFSVGIGRAAIRNALTTPPVTGEGTFFFSGQGPSGNMAAIGAINMAVDQTLRITAFWSVNDVNHSFRCYSGLTLLY